MKKDYAQYRKLQSKRNNSVLALLDVLRFLSISNTFAASVFDSFDFVERTMRKFEP